MAGQEYLKLLNDFERNPANTLKEWYRVLNHILNNLNNGSYVGTDATYVNILDTAGYYTATNAETAFAEIANNVLSGKSRITTVTGTTTLTDAQFGVVICNSASAMTLNLPTANGNANFGYAITNIGAGTVTIDPNGTEKIHNELTFDLYQDETDVIISDNTGWVMSS